MLKQLLVYLSNPKDSEILLSVGLQLAKKHQAKLIAFFAYRIPLIPYADAMFGIAELEMQLIENAQAEAQQVRALFEHATVEHPYPVEWIETRSDAMQHLIEYSGYSDLIILKQAEVEENFLSHSAYISNHVTMMVSCPVLAIPYIGIANTLAERIMIAWNGSREAARAVREAIPLLQYAKKVEIMCIGLNDGDILTKRLQNYLTSHQINSQIHWLPVHQIPVGELLLSRATDESMDLIIMGAYGHSRLQELILGGVTLHLSNHMTIPLFMSH